MTLREIDQLIAEKIMGWQWFTRSVYPSRWLAPGGSKYEYDSLTGTAYQCTEDDMVKPEEEPWWLASEERKFASEGDTRVPCYTTKIDAAFMIRDHVHKHWLFSWRQNFAYQLALAISVRLMSRDIIHPSEVIMFLEPPDICMAALLVQNIPIPEELKRIEINK